MREPSIRGRWLRVRGREGGRERGRVRGGERESKTEREGEGDGAGRERACPHIGVLVDA